MSNRTARCIFLLFCAAVILLALSSKIWAVLFGSPDLQGIHPLFPFANNRQIALLGAALESIVLLGMFSVSNQLIRIALPTSLFLIFLFYRIGLQAINQSFDCGCFGDLHRLLGLRASTVTTFGLACCLVIPVIGSALLVSHWHLTRRHDVIDSRVSSPLAGSSSKKKRRIRFFFGIVGCCLIIPPIQVLYVRFVNLHTTVPALLHRVGAKVGSRGHPDLVWADLKAVPSEFVGTLANREDGGFCSHFGVNLSRISYSLKNSSETGKPPAGASTITQQCARSLFLWQGRSWIRKGIELYYTLWMECLLSKKRIFELYVNVIEFDDGVFGVEAGARHHFSNSIAALNTEQMSRLIAIMPSPRHWSPTNLPPAVEFRRLNIESDIKTLKDRLARGESFPFPCLERR